MRSSRLTLFTLAVIILYAGQALAQSGNTKNFLWKQCDEDVLGFRVDPGPFQKAVGSDFSLVLAEGKATVAIIVQDCSQYWLDGEDLGPTQHMHLWVEIEGSQDVRPVVGAAQTLPTRTWFNLFAGSTNARGREAREASGTSPEPIEEVMLAPPGSPPGGEVTVRPGLSYSWGVSSESHSARLLGFNHDVYLRDSSGRIVLKRIQALGRMLGEPAGGSLEVVGGIDPEGLVGAGTYPVRVFRFIPVWARLTLGEELPD